MSTYRSSLAMTELKDWILKENLRPWLQILSSVVGYAFDDLDWDAVTAGIANTDAEGSRWYEHPLGSEAVSVRLAKEPGTALIMVTASFPRGTSTARRSQFRSRSHIS
jgi:hypothetical protein